jgi:hypothetical protein
VGWAVYDNEAEAEARAAAALTDAKRRAALGFDFGYSAPGTVRSTVNDAEGRVWTVTLP